MKKYLAILLALVMMLSMAACGEKKQEQPLGPGAESPITEMGSLEELNNELGLRLAGPGVMGVTDNYYNIVDCEEFKIAEYGFTVNGYECVFRGSPIYDHDISGVYLEKGLAYEGKDVTDEIDYVFSGEYKLGRWATIDGQYVFLLLDPNKDMDEDTFKSIAEELKYLANPGNLNGDLAAYVGSYADSYSQRAVADVTLAEDGLLHILVHWGSSAWESVNWEMNATLTEDGLLSYYDETKTNIVFKEDGTEEYTVVYEGQEGFFAPSEGKLEWTGAYEEDCRSCVFEMYVAN